ncbi:MAG: PEGA domain-containing protein, partial [Myxococcales bacterium]|nr:PEGA domain-containing protein [Myxococcales bacterium]
PTDTFSYAEAAPSSHIQDEEEEEEPAGLSMWLFTGAAVLALLVVVSVGGAVIYTLIRTSPDDPTGLVAPPTPQPEPPSLPDPRGPKLQAGPVPKDPDPVQPEPVEQPEPIAQVEPVEPAPVAPEPVEQPEPVPDPTPEPVVPVPTPTPSPDPNDGVAVVEPRPVPQPPKPTASITFSTSPVSAKIYLDGVHIANSNFTYGGADFGKHIVRFEKDGFEPLEHQFDVTTPSVKLQTFSLQPLAVAPEPAPEADNMRAVMVFWSDTASVGRSFTAAGKTSPFQNMVTLPVGDLQIEVTLEDDSTKTFACTIPPAESASPFRLHVNTCPQR